MPVHKLILLPADPQTALEDCGRLAASLSAIGLIGDPIRYDGGMFYPTGERFLQLVSFLGCSPAIELDPPGEAAALPAAVAGGLFCHVILSCTDMLQLRADPQTRTPRCPHCGQPVETWQQDVQAWQADPAATGWACSACGHAGTLTDWIFRKTAGFGKVFLEIRGIYPSEAVPGAALLQALRDLTDGDWHYIYIKE